MTHDPSVSAAVSTPDLTGEIAVVTGGSRGIGAAIVSELANAGASVVIAGGSEDHGRSLADALDGCRYMAHDVSSEASWKTLTARVRAEVGEVTVLVNNAGMLDPGPDISGTSVENFERRGRSGG